MTSFIFWTIKLMHDNPLLSIFKDPNKHLKAAGLKSGQKVLEVGCGPGFFTIPAAKIVGDKGFVYAVDVNHLAIEHVEKKIKEGKIKNVKPICTNASDTGLPDNSIDVSFVLGTLHFAGGVGDLISEMNRILKPDGLLSFEKTRGSEEELINIIKGRGFTYSGRDGRILLFKKSK
jgi:ubiquinone/menaquinone biosynthesis C-methylase UbiE